MQTGNFVPESEEVPELLPEGMERRDQAYAQWTVTFDLRLDKHFPQHMKKVEEWGKTHNFNPRSKPRNPWQAPPQIHETLRYAVSSQIFQKRNAFNSRNDVFAVDYPVHPWIEQASIPHNPQWFPNPNFVQVLNLNSDGVLENLASSSDGQLQPADMVKITFRIAFNVGKTAWNVTLVPIQIIRTGRLDPDEMASSLQSEDYRPNAMHKVGQKFSRLRSDCVPNHPSSSKAPVNGVIVTRKIECDSDSANDGGSEDSSLDIQDVSATANAEGYESDLTLHDDDESSPSVPSAVSKSIAKGKRKADDDLESKRTKRAVKRK